LRDPTFSRFDTILECDKPTHRQTNGQTRDDGIYCTVKIVEEKIKKCQNRKK